MKGTHFVHETFGSYKTLQELWDGEIWVEKSIEFHWFIIMPFGFSFSITVQVKIIKGTDFVHETFGSYKTIQELWDGEIWEDHYHVICSVLHHWIML